MSRSDCKDSLGGPGGEVISGITCPGLSVLSGIWALCLCVCLVLCAFVVVCVWCVLLCTCLFMWEETTNVR